MSKKTNKKYTVSTIQPRQIARALVIGLNNAVRSERGLKKVEDRKFSSKSKAKLRAVAKLAVRKVF